MTRIMCKLFKFWGFIFKAELLALFIRVFLSYFFNFPLIISGIFVINIAVISGISYFLVPFILKKFKRKILAIIIMLNITLLFKFGTLIYIAIDDVVVTGAIVYCIYPILGYIVYSTDSIVDSISYISYILDKVHCFFNINPKSYLSYILDKVLCFLNIDPKSILNRGKLPMHTVSEKVFSDTEKKRVIFIWRVMEAQTREV